MVVRGKAGKVPRSAAAVGGHQTPCCGRFGVREDLLHGALLHHDAAIQNGNVIADLLHNTHLMGDDHHRDAQLLVDVLDEGQDGMGGVGVQRTGGLVAQQDLGVRCQCAGNGDALLLTAGQLCRVGVGLIRQAHHLQQLSGALFGICLLYTGQLHGEADVLQAAALHQQVELLEDHRDLPAALAQLGRRELFHLHAVNDHAALGGALQQVDAAHQRGFARARHADDAVNRTIRDGQVDVLQRIHCAVLHLEGLGKMFDLDHRNCSLYGSPLSHGLRRASSPEGRAFCF